MPVLPFLILAAAAAPAPLPLRREESVRVTEVVVRSHIVIRVETAPAAPVPPLAFLYREKKGPRCIAMGDMAGAAVIVPNSVDIVLRDGRRLRARFGASCPGLDYYSGFYVAPTPDAKLCAGRDVVRDRAGGECPVARLRTLSPRK